MIIDLDLTFRTVILDQFLIILGTVNFQFTKSLNGINSDSILSKALIRFVPQNSSIRVDSPEMLDEIQFVLIISLCQKMHLMPSCTCGCIVMLPLILTPMYWSNEWQFYLQCRPLYVLEHHELATIK